MKTNRKSCYALDAFVTLHWNGTAECSCETLFNAKSMKKRYTVTPANSNSNDWKKKQTKYRKSTFQYMFRCIFSVKMNGDSQKTRAHTHTREKSLNPLCIQGRSNANDMPINRFFADKSAYGRSQHTVNTFAVQMHKWFKPSTINYCPRKPW